MDLPFPQTIVCQIGARRHYAVPVALHQAGLLERLYTDFCMADPVLRGVRRLTPSRLASGRLAKLFAREIPEIPRSKVHSFWKSTISNTWSALATRQQTADAYARYCQQNVAFGEAVVRQGFGSADAVYGFNGAAVEIFKAAKHLGLRRILDQTIAPLKTMSTLLEEERQRWHDWDLESAERTESVKQMIEREQAEWVLADVILCGSEFVADALRVEGVHEEKIKVVRWGNQLPPREFTREPLSNRPLRVLIAGTVELRKGAPYVVEAAKLLPKGHFEFRSVGSIRLTSAATAIVQEHVELIGAVPRSEMSAHYEWADVLLHPSLAEGSANVCHEALASGLPVIATANAGSAVDDESSGFLIPIRDSIAIAERLRQIEAGKWDMKAMSRSASDSSNRFDTRAYSSQLTDSIQGRCHKRLSETITNCSP